MTDHGNLSAQSDSSGSRHAKNFIPALVIGVLVSMGCLALPTAGGPAPGDATEAGWSKQFAEEIVSMGSVELLGADSLQFARGAPEPAVAGGPAIGYAMDTAGKQRLADENRIQDHSNWLHASHAHAAVHGQGAPLPGQF